MKERMLVLENGKVFYGSGFGSKEQRIAELVFNTAMVGYQEIMSDPIYAGKMIVMSYPIIGSYGLTDDDYESKGVFASGFVVREYNDNPSNFRFTKTLGEVMEDNGAAGICGVDTREIMRIIRNEGSMLAMITDGNANIADCLEALKASQAQPSKVAEVTCKKIWYSRTRNPIHTVVILDCGIKHSTINTLNKLGCNIVVAPYNTPKSTIMKYRPDGLFISDGPGDPHKVKEAIDLTRQMKGVVPIFGVGLGYLIVGLAYGASVSKMKFGRHGTNYPIQSLADGKLEIASQSHSYVIDKAGFAKTGLTITHINLLDKEIAGIKDSKNNVLAIQYNTQCDSNGASTICPYAEFVDMMKTAGGTTNAQENRY